MTKYLFDTNIWMDWFEDRCSRYGEKVGKHANKALLKILNKSDSIALPTVIMSELRTYYQTEEIDLMLGFLSASGVLVHIDVTKHEKDEANQLAKNKSIPFADCLIAVLARNHSVTVVTRDAHFFNELADITKSIRPNELT